ncbi:MAG: GNAT family N-acetyltransferase [Lachnospiraceae bacterium]|nr:GNAT family N-acetyltransferase [Lachnospiraceae bacterium]MDE6253656.1 GNAT family N-acetyltransferase [Lachnospiraceae bacterium]
MFDWEMFIQSFKDMLNDEKAFIFVAENGDKIVGYLLGFIHTTFFANGNVAWLEEIMVEKNLGGRELVLRNLQHISPGSSIRIKKSKQQER